MPDPQPEEVSALGSLLVMHVAAQATAMGVPRDRLDELWDRLYRDGTRMPKRPSEFAEAIQRAAVDLGITLRTADDR